MNNPFDLQNFFVLQAAEAVTAKQEFDPYDLAPGKELANSITEKLAGFSLARVVGGAVRDAHFGKPFKDIDIAIVGPPMTRIVVKEILRTIPGVGEEFDGEVAAYENQPVRWVIKCKYKGIPVDVVQWQHHRTMIDMLMHFDLNLNTYWLTPEGRIRSLAHTCRNNRDPIRILTPHRGIDQRFEDRIKKLHRKYPMLNWSYDNRLVGILQQR